MAPPTDRQEILARLKQKVADGRPIIGGGAGKQPFLFRQLRRSIITIVPVLLGELIHKICWILRPCVQNCPCLAIMLANQAIVMIRISIRTFC